MLLFITGIFQASRCGKCVGNRRVGRWGGLIPVALSSLSLLEECPYEGVHDIRLVLLQPVAGPGNDVETEMVPDVEAARFGHLLLQERIALTPQQQHGRPDVILTQGEGATETQDERTLACTKCCRILKEKMFPKTELNLWFSDCGVHQQMDCIPSKNNPALIQNKTWITES